MLEPNQLENKINYLENNKIGIDSINKNDKKFTNNKELILQT